MAHEKSHWMVSFGPNFQGSDLSMNRLLRNYIPNPILIIGCSNSVDPAQGKPQTPIFTIEGIKDDGTTTAETLVHIPSAIETEEAEEIGVGHLRDLTESRGDLATRITSQLESLRSRSKEVAVYLGNVLNEELPVNHAILEPLYDVFNFVCRICAYASGGFFWGWWGSGEEFLSQDK